VLTSNNLLMKSEIQTPIGTLVVGYDQHSLQYCLWDFEAHTFDALQSATPVITHPFLNLLQKQIQEFFQRKRTEFALPISLKGTPFQMKAWQALQKIPYGQTWSYSDQAKALKTNAVRAVGSANAKNPICLILPCHRVTRSDGTLGGYAGGMQIKEKLLKFEKGEIHF